jgi:hypothetical protein
LNEEEKFYKTANAALTPFRILGKLFEIAGALILLAIWGLVVGIDWFLGWFDQTFLWPIRHGGHYFNLVALVVILVAVIALWTWLIKESYL